MAASEMANTSFLPLPSSHSLPRHFTFTPLPPPPIHRVLCLGFNLLICLCAAQRRSQVDRNSFYVISRLWDLATGLALPHGLPLEMPSPTSSASTVEMESSFTPRPQKSLGHILLPVLENFIVETNWKHVAFKLCAYSYLGLILWLTWHVCPFSKLWVVHRQADRVPIIRQDFAKYHSFVVWTFGDTDHGAVTLAHSKASLSAAFELQTSTSHLERTKMDCGLAMLTAQVGKHSLRQ